MGFGEYFRRGNGYSRPSNREDTDSRLKKLEIAVKELQTRYSTIMNNRATSQKGSNNKRQNNIGTNQNVSNNKRPNNKGSKSNAELLQIARNYYYASKENVKKHKAILNKHNLNLIVGFYGSRVNVVHKVTGRQIGNIGGGFGQM